MRHRGALMADPETTEHAYDFFKFGNGTKWHIRDFTFSAGMIKPVCTFARDIREVNGIEYGTRTPGGPICRQCLWGRERIHWDRAEDAARKARRAA